MFASNHNKSQIPFPPEPALSRRVIALAFFLGTVFGSGANYGFQRGGMMPPPVNSPTYDLIALGMTLVEARAILGPGVEVRKTQTETVMEWASATKQKTIAVFENGRLVEKEQAVQ